MSYETLQEFVDSDGLELRAEAAKGIIRGVKILGLASRNGRQYTPEAIEKAAHLYERVKVNVNHPGTKLQEPRDYRDRLGQIRTVTVRDDGLFGDLYFNPKHPVAEQLVWDAQNAPANVGLSHNVLAGVRNRDGRQVVEEIRAVQSVDLVADPATTQGLYEAALERGKQHQKEDSTVSDLKTLTIEEVLTASW